MLKGSLLQTAAGQRRVKVTLACEPCRSRKQKCDGVRPECSRCNKHMLRCVYRDQTSPPRQRRPVGQDDQTGPNHADFTRQVNAAIDARLSPTSPKDSRLKLVSMPGAALFGLLQPPGDVDVNALPSRLEMERLIGLYHERLHATDAILDWGQFQKDYVAFLDGHLKLTAPQLRIFRGSLNVILALASQLSEQEQFESRSRNSHLFFERAWEGVRVGNMVWGEHDSIGLIQCLLLMVKFLQGTSSARRVCMAVGAAVRIAQSMGLHNRGDDGSYESRLWLSCVCIERNISSILGRTSTVTITSWPASIQTTYLCKSAELYEILNHIIIAQTPAPMTGPIDRFGLALLYRSEDETSIVSRLAMSLNKFEDSLPEPLKFGSGLEQPLATRQQAALMFLKLRHARILLLRPVFFSYCKVDGSNLTTGMRLASSIAENCAVMCITAAQDVAFATQQLHNTGLIPWWQRFFFLQLSLTILLATKLRPGLEASTGAHAFWDVALATLRDEAHLSPFMQQCAETFEKLAMKFTAMIQMAQKEESPSSLDLSMQTVWDDMNLVDSFAFGLDDMTWLDNFESAS